MASSWNYVYDQTNCSGIFYDNDPREDVVQETNETTHRGPHLNDPMRGPCVCVTTMAVETLQPRSNEMNLPPLPPPPPPPRSQPDRIYLPALRVSAKVSIKAMVAETIITQSFHNLKDTSIERASYSFPLYQDSVVHRFKCLIGKHRVIEGVVEPKATAKAEFEKAVARQRVAAMLEEHTPEIFETHIGSIPAREVIRVEVSYVSELKVDLLSQDVVFVLPMSIAPRYGMPPDGYSEGNSTIEEQGLEISVDVSLPVPITSLASRSHPVSVTIGSTAPTSFKDMNTEPDLRKGNATLSNRSAELKRDFILLISPKESISNTRAFMEPHPEYNDHSAIMVTISPQDFARNASSTDYSKCEILFVIDCSGSMDDKVNDLRTAMKVAIRSLPEGCFFNMCFFGSSHELHWESSKPATQENSDEAFFRSARLAADKGGTKLNSALRHVITSRTPNMETNVIVVTDGETWDTEQIHASVRETNKEQGVRFFCLGIGDRVSHALVEGIGRQGCGLSEVVVVAEPGKWEARVIRLLKGALTPASWHITLHPGPLISDTENLYSTLGRGNPIFPNLRAPSFIQAPFQIPKLHTFSRLSVFLLVNNSTLRDAGSNIHMTAESSSGQTVDLAVDLERLESPPSVVHVLATHAVIKDLENETSWLHGVQHEEHHRGGDDKFKEIVKQEAETVGMTWSITGKWTSFIAVEKLGSNAHVRSLVHLYRPEVLPLPGPSMMADNERTKNRVARVHRQEVPSARTRNTLGSLQQIAGFPSMACSSFQIPMWEPWYAPESPSPPLSIQDYLKEEGCVQRAQESVTDPPTSGNSVEDIVSAQLSTGCFVFHSTSLSILLSAFDGKAIQQMRSQLAVQSFGYEESLLHTVLAMVYLEMRFREELELLELVMDKAKKWLEENIQGEKDKIWEIARSAYVGNGVQGSN